jgi:hypothetical protein
MLGLIKTLLEDDVLIFEEDMKTVEAWINNDPDLITDLIKVHKFAEENPDVIISEYIYPTYKGLVYELATFDVDLAMYLSMAIDKLGIRSKNLVVGIAYPKEEVEYESD